MNFVEYLDCTGGNGSNHSKYTNIGIALLEKDYQSKFFPTSVKQKKHLESKLVQLYNEFNLIKEDNNDKICFNSINHSQNQRYTEQVYLYCELLDRINKSNSPNELDLSTTFDFGCGQGGSTLFLSTIYKQVIASDISDYELKFLNEKVKEFDITNVETSTHSGFKMLNNNPNQYNLINALWLGENNTDKSFLEEFVSSSRNGLKENGIILVKSDFSTVQKLEKLDRGFKINKNSPSVIIARKINDEFEPIN